MNVDATPSSRCAPEPDNATRASRLRWRSMNKLLGLVAVLSVISVSADALKGSRPNIILVMTDDQGPHLSYEGHPYIQTPNIDRMADQSLRLREFHVSPTCSPTRAAVLSGRHEFRNGVTGTTKERECMALSTTTFPQLLQTAGYETGLFGKWHLGDAKEFRPAQRGFFETLIHGAGGIGQDYSRVKIKDPEVKKRVKEPVFGSCADFPPNAKNRYTDPVLLHNEQVVQGKGYCTDIFFDGALSWMKQSLDGNKPFFAMIVPNTPHSPLIATEESKARILKRMPDFNDKIASHNDKSLKADGLLEYYGMIENIDDNMGRLFQSLEEWGALENTLVIFTTDNGATTRHGGTSIHNAGFKSGKGSVHEGGGHVPCYWFWKGKLQPADTKSLTAHIDLYKTFCELAGAAIPGNIQELDGRSLLPILGNPKAKWEDRTLYHTAGRWEYGVEPQRDKRWAVRTQKWRMVGGKELYDIENDPFEKENVIKQHPEVMERLQKKYYAWWDETLPFMVNENRTWEKDEPPFHTLYKEATANGELPVFNPREY